MELLESTKSKITNDEIANIYRNHCISISFITNTSHNIVSNDYQHDSRVLYKFIHDKSFVQLLDTSPKNLMFLKILIQIFQILNYGLLNR